MQNGADVVVSSRKKEVCDQVARDLSALGPGKCYNTKNFDFQNLVLHSAPADLATQAGMDQLVKDVAARCFQFSKGGKLFWMQ